MEEKVTLTDNQKARIKNIDMVTGSIALIGAIGGVVYAKKTGGGFWRYVGYWIVGALVVGTPARLIALPFKNNILKKGDTESEQNKESENPETKEIKS